MADVLVSCQSSCLGLASPEGGSNQRGIPRNQYPSRHLLRFGKLYPSLKPWSTQLGWEVCSWSRGILEMCTQRGVVGKLGRRQRLESRSVWAGLRSLTLAQGLWGGRGIRPSPLLRLNIILVGACQTKSSGRGRCGQGENVMPIRPKNIGSIVLSSLGSIHGGSLDDESDPPQVHRPGLCISEGPKSCRQG